MSVLNVCAQDNNDTINPSHSAIGIFAGPNSTMAFNIPQGYTQYVTVSFSPGIYGAFDISKKWRAEASISYISYGSKYIRTRSNQNQNDTLFVYGKYSTYAGYASGMLLFKYKLNNKNGFLIGARLSKMVSSIGSYYSGYVSQGKLIMTGMDNDDNGLINMTHLFDLGAIGGYEYNITPLLSVSALLNVGLLPIMKKSEVDNSVLANNYNRSLQLRLSYALFK
jgi:hypothetical protein